MLVEKEVKGYSGWFMLFLLTAILAGAVFLLIRTASGGAEGVGRAVNQAVVMTFIGIFAFNYVFTQTLLATHPDILIIR